MSCMKHELFFSCAFFPLIEPGGSNLFERCVKGQEDLLSLHMVTVF